MTVKIDTDADINSIRLKESAVPDTPASGYGQLYAKSDGKVYFKNDAGLEIDLTFTGTAGTGGWALISDQLLLAPGTFTVSSIPSSYRTLILYADLRSSVNAVSDSAVIKVGNGTLDTGNNYEYIIRWEGSSASNQQSTGDGQLKSVIIPGATAVAGNYGILEIIANEYATTGTWRNFLIRGGQMDATAYRAAHGVGSWKNSNLPVDILYVGTIGTGTFATGSRLRLYGV